MTDHSTKHHSGFMGYIMQSKIGTSLGKQSCSLRKTSESKLVCLDDRLKRLNKKYL